MFVGAKLMFKNNEDMDKFTRPDVNHPIDIYVGKDTNYRNTLLILSPFKPIKLKSSNVMDVFIGQRSDDAWAISLSLTDNKFNDIFCHFCDDIIESSRNATSIRNGVLFICDRYEQWQKLLKSNKSNFLTKNEIKGLIGELIFLKSFLIPIYGEIDALSSWLGPEKLPQDFICQDKWYEVKSISSNMDSVKISSLEQLDTKQDGELVVIHLDSTSNTDMYKININEYYKNLLNSLTSEKSKFLLCKKLLNIHFFPCEEYDEYNFKFIDYKRYFINKKFPCIRKNQIPDSILSMKYEISLYSLQEFILKEGYQWI